MIEINLLPESQRARQGLATDGNAGAGLRIDVWGVALLISALTIPPGTAALWWVHRTEALELGARLDAVLADSARLAELRAASDSLAARSREIRERVALVEQLDRDRFAWPHLMDEISRALPPPAWLTSLRQLSPPPDLSVELHGVAGHPLAITEFVRALGMSDHITDVKIVGSQQQRSEPDQVSRQAFTLVLRLGHAPAERRVGPT
ncbi:MAG: PilN domain-containing protein [Gemmatimonadota bacterium]|uniref:PilN domain-containing protein n=1 Tax=Candidatus Palauibacter scopulicola TaxID=3056741 RepID=UPI00238DE326|nr:PilN domain-containing protein [Candidatus Palauibacter scopulicola]MDE2663177.1 PilN domain-containing protein [Candidatus Palauibacter scopulicola]